MSSTLAQVEEEPHFHLGPDDSRRLPLAEADLERCTVDRNLTIHRRRVTLALPMEWHLDGLCDALDREDSDDDIRVRAGAAHFGGVKFGRRKALHVEPIRPSNGLVDVVAAHVRAWHRDRDIDATVGEAIGIELHGGVEGSKNTRRRGALERCAEPELARGRVRGPIDRARAGAGTDD